MKTAIVLGGSGFIGHHMARRLKNEGYWIRVVDLKEYEYGDMDFAHEFVKGDLRDTNFCASVLRLDFYEGRETPVAYSYLQQPFTESGLPDEVYQFACDMGGAGYVFTGENDANVMQSAKINLNVCDILAYRQFTGKVFYSSSACIYPQEFQEVSPFDIKELMFEGAHQLECGLLESSAYPANPDSEYGWEKLFSERLFLAYGRNHNLNVRIARFHNIYGPEGTYKGGREKAPAAMCRKVIEFLYATTSEHHNQIEIWGDGEQTRSFLYIDDCIDAVRLLMQSEFKEPINIGSEEMVSINQLADLAIEFSGKEFNKQYDLTKPQGVRGRNSDNTLIESVLNWKPKLSLKDGLCKTFNWIKNEIEK